MIAIVYSETSKEASSSRSAGRRGVSSSGGREGAATDSPPGPAKRKQATAAPQKLVRTDRNAGSLDAFLRPSQPMFSPMEVSAKKAGGGTATARRRSSSEVDGSREYQGSGEREKVESRADRRGSSAASGDAAVNLTSAGASSGEGEPRAVLEVSSDEDGRSGDGGDALCVCPATETGSADEDGESSTTPENIADTLENPRESTRSNGSSSSGHEEEAKRFESGTGAKTRKRRKPAKPFAGIGKRARKNCDCCGGKRPRGPTGSIVLTEEIPGTSRSTASLSGDNVDSIPSQQTPPDVGVAARAQQQRKRPLTFVDTDCRYHSVRSLIGDFKAQVTAYTEGGLVMGGDVLWACLVA